MSTQPQPPIFKAGDEVYANYANEKLAGTVRRVENDGSLYVKFLAPHADLGDGDTFTPADLTLNLDNVDATERLLDHAIDCVRRGWFVFPCYPKMKLPAGEVVPHGVKDATNDENQVRAWWAKNPNYNPAIALGPSNLVVYDFDSISPFDNLPATFTVQTGREPVNGILGIQKYFVGSCKTHAHQGSGGEVRSRGAYVLAPGSIHPSGNPYKIIEDLPLAVSPEQNQEAQKPAGPAVGTAEQEEFAQYIEAAFAAADIDYKARTANANGEGGFKWLIRCPWSLDHTAGTDFDSSSAVILWASGKRIYACQHGHCKEIHQWEHLRKYMEEKVGHFLQFGDPVGGVTFDSKTPASTSAATPASQPQSAEASDETTTKQSGKVTRAMLLRRGDQYDPSIIPWLWPNRIVANNVNVFSGEPDKGKSLCWADFVARLTTGRDFPDSPNESGPVDVIVMASEDDIDTTILPRLIAAEADIQRVHFVEIQENESGTIIEGIAALDRDLPTIGKLIEDLSNTGVNVALIVVDPIIAFIGDADPNKDKEVRPIFTRMKSFSKKHGLAWLTVNHLNKNSSATSINRTSGAKSFVSAPRATWMFADDPDNPERRLMMKGKGNLVKQGIKSLAYRITETSIQYRGKDFVDHKQRPVGVPRIQWDGESEHVADDVLQAAADPASRRSIKAEDLVKRLLDESQIGVVLASEVYRAGESESPTIGEDKLRRAKSKLKLEVFRLNERWYWARGKAEMKAFRATGGLYIVKSEQDNTLYEQEENQA